MRIQEKVDAAREYVRWRESTGRFGSLDGEDLRAWEAEQRQHEVVETLRDVIELLDTDAAESVEVARRTLANLLGGLS